MNGDAMNARSMNSPRPPVRIARGVCVAAALFATLAAADAAAQKGPSVQQGPPNALQGFSQNRGQPINIQSDSLVVRDKDKVATFSGNVHVVQGDTEMRSKALVVYYVDQSKPETAPPNALKTASAAGSSDSQQQQQQQIRRIEATGGVTVTQRDQNAVGDNGVFDMQANTVTLNGNVVVTHGKDIVRGQRLTVDLGTGVSKIDGGRVDALFGAAPGNMPAPPPCPTTPSHKEEGCSSQPNHPN